MEQHEVFAYAIDAVESLGLTYMVVGSVASIAYGEPRMTLDMDIVLDMRPEHASVFCARFPSPEFYVSPQAILQAIIHRTQFNVIHPDSGNKIDFMLPKHDQWSRMQLAQRRPKEILNGRSAYTARPEDVILSKMLYFREGQSDKHLRDIAGMLKVSGDIIDREYVGKWARELDVVDIWQAILQRVGMAS